MTNLDEGLPIEDFIHALSSQLDRAQAMMRLKMGAGLPLTFAVKDISIDLRAHVNMVKNRVVIYPAGPGDAEASVLHLSLTTITRPMIEENTRELERDEPSLKEVLGDDLDDDEQRRLEWAGIHSASQLRELQRQGGENVIEQLAQIPALRLRKALERASTPHVSRVLSDGDSMLHIHGMNLMQQDTEPSVSIGGERVAVMQASEKELVVVPLPHQMSGTLSIETAPGMVIEKIFETPFGQSAGVLK